MDQIVIFFCKVVSKLSKALNIGGGGTWPGEIAISLSPHILSSFSKKLKKGTILVVGTNGKTTTSLMIRDVLEKWGDVVVHNATGANLVNGLVSAFISKSSLFGTLSADVAVFEVDENSLPHVLKEITPTFIVVTNLFRDQLDRYGEVDVIVEKWEKAFEDLPATTSLILNCDDPAVAFLGKKTKAKKSYFGIQDKKYFLKNDEHATDSLFCLNCGKRLKYQGVYYSHLGIWSCTCGNTRPHPQVSSATSNLPGLYNYYNTLGVYALFSNLKKIDKKFIDKTLSQFKPAFGRQEEFEIDDKKIKIFLSKNPTGFNQSLRTILELGAKQILLVLNDRIPDGRDISWIWDVDFETIPNNISVFVSGDRTYDMAIRIKYAKESEYKRLIVEENLEKSIHTSLEHTKKNETLYILPTYSAMLDVRKILTGKKIL